MSAVRRAAGAVRGAGAAVAFALGRENRLVDGGANQLVIDPFP